jgi:hypothetical protein
MSARDPLDAYIRAQDARHSGICRLLREEIDAPP